MEHRSMIEQLRKTVVDLNAGISWYIQLGINFYARLQKAEKLMKPNNTVFAEYKRLMSDAAQYFSFLVDTRNESGGAHDDFVRVEEIDDGHNEEKEKEKDRENGSVSMLDANKVTCDHTSATEAGATEAEERVTALDDDDDDDDDDDFPSFDRPVRPGTANRVPISVFAARPGSTSKQPSSPLSDNVAQQVQEAPSPAAPTFPISFGFSELSVKPGEECETTAVQEPIQEPVQEQEHHTTAPNTSARSRYGRGGIERGRGRRGRGTNSSRLPLRGARGSHLGNSVTDTNSGIGSSPAATAFPINYGFSEP